MSFFCSVNRTRATRVEAPWYHPCRDVAVKIVPRHNAGPAQQKNALAVFTTTQYNANMSIYRFFADLIVVLHVTYVAFVVLALPLILLGAFLDWAWVCNFWFRLVHFAMIAVVVAEALLGIVCPLTTWENQLRVWAGDADYPGSFVGRWANELLFFEAPPWVFTVIYCLFGLAVFAALVWAPPRRPSRRRVTN